MADENKVSFPLLQRVISSKAHMSAKLNNELQVAFDNRKRMLKKWIESLEEVMLILEKNGIDAVLIKSLKGFDNPSMDLDLLVKNNFEAFQAARILQKLDYQCHTADDNRKVSCKAKGPSDKIDVDIYTKIGWRNVDINLVDHEKIWRRKRLVRFHELKVPVPSVEDDILINCAHSLFGHHQYFLCDLFYLVDAFKKKLQIDYMFKISKKFGWSIGLFSFLNYSNYLYKKFFGKQIFEEDLLLRFREQVAFSTSKIGRVNLKEIRFPFRCPISWDFYIWIEKSFLQNAKSRLRLKENGILATDNIRMLVSSICDSLSKHVKG